MLTLWLCDRRGDNACARGIYAPALQPETLMMRLPHQRSVHPLHTRNAAGDMYLRPPHVTVATAVEPCDPDGPTPAHKSWRHANWLNWVSIVNKQDYARLQGFDFMVVAVQVTHNVLSLISYPHKHSTISW